MGHAGDAGQEGEDRQGRPFEDEVSCWVGLTVCWVVEKAALNHHAVRHVQVLTAVLKCCQAAHCESLGLKILLRHHCEVISSNLESSSSVVHGVMASYRLQSKVNRGPVISRTLTRDLVRIHFPVARHY